MAPLVIYILLFVAIGAGFIIINLLVGKLLRPSRPHTEKEEIYECGEPTIGSAWVQFDLRFYVVALLFVIFDVEVAFFFPWATVFGKANSVANDNLPVEQRAQAFLDLTPNTATPQDAKKVDRVRDLLNNATPEARTALEEELEPARSPAQSLAWIALWDILVFFGVLLVGFAYLWKRGDLQWVRSVSSEAAVPLRHVQKGEPGALASGALQPSGR